MGRFVICAFKPKTGMEQKLVDVVEKHWQVLQQQNLVTSRPHYVMQAADGTVVEVFEWRSPEAIEQAHQNPAVLALWAEYELACDYVPLSSVPESQKLFSEFQPLGS